MGISTASGRPNIVVVLADDLGYGDIGAFNPDSRIPTPGIDRLVAEGVRLTDVHSASVCIPSRYQLLTGRYLYRSDRELQRDALIEPGQATVASLLREQGYRTAMIGKWHLGFEDLGVHPDPGDATTTLRGGPVDHGFDSYYGIPASLDVAPYFFIEDDRVVDAPTGTIDEQHTPGLRWPQGEFWTGGGIAPGYRHEDVVPELTDRAVAFIEGRAGDAQPFFLYYALPAPHAPWVPTPEFRGRSGAGDYGDFVVEVDDVVRRVTEALDAAGKSGDTLLVVTSDNGPTWYPEDVARTGHRSAGNWRGMKNDAWEGGNRMPFVARWPDRIPAGASVDGLVSFTDVLPTFVGLAGGSVPESAAIDGVDALPALTASGDGSARTSVVLEGDRDLALRAGSWKLIPWLRDRSVFDILFPPGGGFDRNAAIADDAPEPGGPTGQLYDLSRDPAETRNVFADHPDVVAELTRILDAERRPASTRRHDETTVATAAVRDSGDGTTPGMGGSMGEGYGP